jgi:hypothetical protein
MEKKISGEGGEPDRASSVIMVFGRFRVLSSYRKQSVKCLKIGCDLSLGHSSHSSTHSVLCKLFSWTGTFK